MTKVGGNKTVPIANVDVQQKTINKIVVSGTAIKDYDGKRDAAVTGLTFKSELPEAEQLRMLR